MRLHAWESNLDGFTRHQRDGEALNTYYRTHPEFASDPRNVHLGLASDGFNPFGTMSSTYSICPVFLTSIFREYIKRSSRGKRPSPTEIEMRVNKEFVDWFQKSVSKQSLFIVYV
ncbi:hypothetical protein RDI58_026904 [Solanum bulbocastanum]|uniref:Uncharacterized protein n=1 Tax=Solanum bulbocastanum TaxID=147425 RepID=A0AAN8Y3S7_SOLBU